MERTNPKDASEFKHDAPEAIVSNLAVFDAKIHLLSSANGEHSLVRPVPLPLTSYESQRQRNDDRGCPIRACAERPGNTKTCVNVYEFRSRLLEISAYRPFRNISTTLTYRHIDQFGSYISCA